MEKIDVKEYAIDYSYTDEFDFYLQDAYWRDEYSTERAYDMMLASAAKDGVELEGVDEFNYDKFFWDVYIDTEKGLS